MTDKKKYKSETNSDYGLRKEIIIVYSGNAIIISQTEF